MDGRGRPRKAICKSETIHMRVTAVEKQALLEQAQAQKISLAELILRHCLPTTSPARQPVGEQLSVFVQLPLDTLSIRFPKKALTKSFAVDLDKKGPKTEK
ncbi:hypothetical protein [Spirosoma flavum]|uniref:Uncharacterized protein n=1 Tax=Spirosoma flavum TaxID=2048557 RepID=A0ABW6AKZ4_9BACT